MSGAALQFPRRFWRRLEWLTELSRNRSITKVVILVTFGIKEKAARLRGAAFKRRTDA